MKSSKELPYSVTSRCTWGSQCTSLIYQSTVYEIEEKLWETQVSNEGLSANY